MTRFLPFAALLACALSALAHAGPSVYLEELTWTELRDRGRGQDHHDHRPGRRDRAERPPQVTLGKHNARVKILFGGRSSRALGNTLVAPVIAYVP